MDPLLVAALRRYADDHIETGGFLRAVLEGDLYQAVYHADRENLCLCRIPEIVFYIRQHLSESSYGSREAVDGWLDK